MSLGTATGDGAAASVGMVRAPSAEESMRRLYAEVRDSRIGGMSTQAAWVVFTGLASQLMDPAIYTERRTEMLQDLATIRRFGERAPERIYADPATRAGEAERSARAVDRLVALLGVLDDPQGDLSAHQREQLLGSIYVLLDTLFAHQRRMAAMLPAQA